MDTFSLVRHNKFGMLTREVFKSVESIKSMGKVIELIYYNEQGFRVHSFIPISDNPSFEVI